MIYIIKGYDIRYGTAAKADIFGRFESLRECYQYLNRLKTGCLGDTHRFFVEGVRPDGSKANTFY